MLFLQPRTNFAAPGETHSPDGALRAMRCERMKWLLVAFAVADVPIVFGGGIVPDWIAAPIVTGQMTLLGLWLAAGRTPPWRRMICTAGWLFVLAWGKNRSTLISDPRMLLVWFGMPLLLTAAIVMLLRLLGMRVAAAEIESRDERRPFQFSLAHMMQLTTAVALCVATFLALPKSEVLTFAPFWTALVLDSILYATLATAFLLAVLSRGHLLIRIVALCAGTLLFAIFASLIALRTRPVASIERLKYDIFRLSIAPLLGSDAFLLGRTLIVVTILALSLAVVQSCGYYITWRSQQLPRHGPPPLPL